MRKGDIIRVPRSQTHRMRLSLAMRCNRNQEPIRSEVTKERIGRGMRGNTNTFGKSYGFETRLKDSIAKVGAVNPAWNGGSSFTPYPPEFNVNLKRIILSRDSYTCQLCKAQPEDKRRLHPHHIDYDKNNCHAENLITLCHNCHSKTNHHRNEWRVVNGRFKRVSSHVV